ncbi:hypothetical protein [Saccharopolyspora griseoalba]|uniref:Uncharacterized protein n=1 Tax=Saccharopolyspora griseoalba TaxID=1431848 RepID=A0ABW2LE90_9PSEU
MNATRPGWLSHQTVSTWVHSPIRPKSEICWQASIDEFLTVLASMFDDRGFYVLDELEAALSFASCLQLVGLMHELGERRA